MIRDKTLSRNSRLEGCLLQPRTHLAPFASGYWQQQPKPALVPLFETAVRRTDRGWCLSFMGPNQDGTSVTRWSLFGHSRPLISSDMPPILSIDSNHRQHTTQAVIVCLLEECAFEEWRAREAAYPMCLPAALRILNPANMFCNMQCTTVCITAAGSRVAKRTPGSTPGTCPCGLPQRVARQDRRSVTEGCFPAI